MLTLYPKSDYVGNRAFREELRWNGVLGLSLSSARITLLGRERATKDLCPDMIKDERPRRISHQEERPHQKSTWYYLNLGLLAFTTVKKTNFCGLTCLWLDHNSCLTSGWLELQVVHVWLSCAWLYHFYHQCYKAPGRIVMDAVPPVVQASRNVKTRSLWCYVKWSWEVNIIGKGQVTVCYVKKVEENKRHWNRK